MGIHARLLKVASGVLLLAFAAGACSSSAAQKRASSPSPTVSATAQAGTTRFPLRNEAAKVDTVAPPAGIRIGRCPGLSFKFPRTIDPKKSFVITLVDPYRGFGPQCPTLKNGRTCTIPFQGSWRLEGTPVGSLVMQIFEDDNEQPLKSVEFGPIGPRGNFGRLLKIQYPVGKKAIKATFRALLKDATGQIVAVGPPQTVPIPSCVG